MGCEYIYNNQKYTFDEMAALLENGLADDLLRKNVITDASAFASLEDKTPQTIQMTPSDTSVDLKNTRRFVRTIANQAKSVVKALRKLAPNLNLTIHTTEEAWNALYDKLLTEGYTPEDLANFKNTDGFYTEDGVIHLNAPLMEKRNRQSVLYHESTHAVTNALFNSRPELRDQMEGQIRQLANDPSVDPKYKDAIQRTINFGQNYLNYKREDGTPIYDANFAKNETIVEFVSKICTGEIQITPKEKSAWDNLVSILNKLGIMVGFNVRLNNQDVTVNNVLEFANTLNKAFKSGNEISFEEAATELADEDKIETPTNSADFVGQEVIYNGERGTITQDEGGKITFETDTKVYDFDGSEEVKPVNKYKYNEESNTISIGDKNYRVLNVNRQESYPEGEVVFKSVNVADANNKKKTLRDPELAKQVYESQQQRGIIPSMSEDVEIDSEALVNEIASPIQVDGELITPAKAEIKVSSLSSESDAVTEDKLKNSLIPSVSVEEPIVRVLGESGIKKIVGIENNQFDDLVKSGNIQFGIDALTLNDSLGMVSHPDTMMVGEIRSEMYDNKGKKILDETGRPIEETIGIGSGGVYFATNDIWAFREESKANHFCTKLNNLLKIARKNDPNASVYYWLGKGGPGKMLSNKEAPKAIVKIFENLHRGKIISDDVLIKSIQGALQVSDAKLDKAYSDKLKDAGDDPKKLKEAELFKKEIDKKKNNAKKYLEKLVKSKGLSIENVLEDVFADDSTFNDRGSAIKTLLQKVFSSVGKKNQPKLIEYFGIKDVTTQDAFMDEVSKALFEEPILLDVPKEHIYAAIKIDSEIEPYTGEHTTYPAHVRFKEQGKKPTLLFFEKPFLSTGSFVNLKNGDSLKSSQLGYSSVPISVETKAKITPSMSEDIRTGDLTSASSAYENMNEDGMGNYVFYPSVVTNGNADVSADGIVELSVDKGNKESIVRVPFEGVYPLDTNPLGVEGESKKAMAKNALDLGYPVVVDQKEDGNVEVFSSTIIPAEPIGTQEFTQNKQIIIPSMFGTPTAEVIEPGRLGAKEVKNVSYNAGPVRELSKFQTTSLGKVFMEYFTPTGGATSMQKELMEQLAGEQSFIESKLKKNYLALKKSIDKFVDNEGKKVGLTRQTVQTIVNKAMDGEIDPKTGKPFLDQLPSNIADNVVCARQSITNLQEVLANSGLLPADMALTIAMSQGTYMKDSFAAFEVKPYNWLRGKITGKKNKYFKNIPEQTRERVRSYFVSQALLGKLDSGFNVSLADYKKNYEDPYFELLAKDPTAQMAATRQAGIAKSEAYRELEEKAKRFAQSKIDEIEDYNPNGDIMFSLSGAPIKMTDYVEKNPNLAPEMKEYLGYIVDPATSFKLTAMKLNRMLYSHQTMQQMKNEGLLSGDVVPSSEATPKGWIKLGKISQRDSKTMMGTASDEVDAVNKYGPLKGCSVSPEFYQLVFNTPVTGNWYYRNIASPVKKNLAVVNVKNIIRNVFGYTYFGGASGAIPEAIMYVGPLMKVNKNKIKTAKEFKDWFVNVFEEAQKRGINTSIEYSEIRRMAEQLGDDEEILNSVRKSGNPAFELYNKVSDIIFNAPKSVSDAFGKVIYYGDAIPKTLMFEVFRNTNAYDMARTTFYGLSEEQKEQASRIAERKVKATTVTDSRAIKGADVLQRKVGIFGSFPRFTAEAIRTFINCHYIMVNPSFLYEGEEFSSNKDQNKIIKTRMNRKNRFVALAGLSFYYGAFDILRSLMGLGDDDDDLQKIDIPSNGILEALQLIYKEKGTMTQSEALRKMLPEYDKFAELQFKVNDDGTVSYRNESTADPFGIIGQAYRSILYSDGPTSAATNLVKNVATPALGLEVAFATALEIFNGENSKGEPIYAPDDLTSKQFEDIASYFARKTGPNVYSSGMRYRDLVRMGKREPGEGVASNALDFASYTFGEGVLGRESVIDVKKKLQSQVSKVKQDWTTDARLYSGEFYRTIDPKDREAINDQRDEAARRNAYKLHKLVLAAYALNLSEAEVKDVFKKSAISKKVRKAALRGGDYLDKLDVKDIEEKD
jgi:hypothetical protein